MRRARIIRCGLPPFNAENRNVQGDFTLAGGCARRPLLRRRMSMETSGARCWRSICCWRSGWSCALTATRASGLTPESTGLRLVARCGCRTSLHGLTSAGARRRPTHRGRSAKVRGRHRVRTRQRAGGADDVARTAPAMKGPRRRPRLDRCRDKHRRALVLSRGGFVLTWGVKRAMPVIDAYGGADRNGLPV